MSEKEAKEEHEKLRDWCHRCGEDLADHATATVDDEQHRICPVEERAVMDENPQEQLGAFVSADDYDGKEDNNG